MSWSPSPVLVSTLRILGKGTIRYYVFGSQSPTALQLIYLHGAPSSGQEPFCLQAAATDLGIRIVSLDRPGWGESSSDPSLTFESFAKDYVGALANHLGISRFVVVGISGGSRFALAVGRYLPQRVPLVVQIGTTGPDHGPWFSAWYRVKSGFAGRFGESVCKGLLSMDRAIMRVRLLALGGDVDTQGALKWFPVMDKDGTLHPPADPSGPPSKFGGVRAYLLSWMFSKPDMDAFRSQPHFANIFFEIAGIKSGLQGVWMDGLLQASSRAQFNVRDMRGSGVKILVLHGADDVNCPAWGAEKFKEVVDHEDLDLRIIAGEGHVSLPLRRPMDTLQIIKNLADTS
ncbi:hypothetical protein HK100_011710, partial [Physocladia obscura]